MIYIKTIDRSRNRFSVYADEPCNLRFYSARYTENEIRVFLRIDAPRRVSYVYNPFRWPGESHVLFFNGKILSMDGER